MKGTLDPAWHEKFSFYVSESYATIDVAIFDSNLLMKDEFMGRVEIPVKSLTFDEPVEKWFQLQPLQAGRAVTGDIFLKYADVFFWISASFNTCSFLFRASIAESFLLEYSFLFSQLQIKLTRG